MTGQATSKPICPSCGAEVPPDAPRGYCLKCLFALGTTDADSLVNAASPSPGGEGVQHSPQSTDPPLRSFGDYELLEEIARGGMGVVYKARQKSLGRIVAVKMLLFGDQSSKDLAQRFRAEAAAAASLQHPNIVAIHEVSAHEGQPFFAMDFIEGRSLAKLSAECEVRNAQWLHRAARYVKTVAEAIHYAHERGILHRDLKPSNVLIDPFDQPRVTDFGLAKRLHHDSELTLSGQVLGSPNYMPPEQAAAKRGLVGRRSDVYSLGAILYHLLTGRPPFVGETLTDTLQNVVNDEPVSPSLLNPSVPRDLETLCLKCLEKEPARRYQTAQALAEELDRFLKAEPIRARPIGRTAKLWRWCRRKPVLAFLGSTTLVLLLAVAFGSPIAIYRINRERARAELSELDAHRKAYASDMNLVQRALELNNLNSALALLNHHTPVQKSEIRNRKPEIQDLRGWEWRYLWSQCQSDAQSVFYRTSNNISALTTSHDGKWLAIGENSQGVSVWDLATRQKIAGLSAGGAVVRAAFSPRELLLAYSVETGSGSSNRQDSLRLWNGATRQIMTNLSIGGVCLGLAFSHDGGTLVASTQNPDNQLTLWRVADGTRLAQYATPQIGPLGGTPFAVMGDLSIAAHATGDDNTGDDNVRVIDLATGQQRWKFKATGDYVTSLAFSPDGKILAVGEGFTESAIHLWDVASKLEIGSLHGHRVGVLQLLFWPDGKTLASASADQTIRLWDVSDPTKGKSLRTLRGHKAAVTALALLPDNRTLVSGSDEVCLWDTVAPRRSRQPVILPTKVEEWRFAPGSKSVVTVDIQGNVVEWRGTDFQEMQPLLKVGAFDEVRISEDCRWLADASAGRGIRVWDLRNRRRIGGFTPPAGVDPTTGREYTHSRTRIGGYTDNPGPVILCQFLSEGRKLMIAHRSDNSLHEWNLDTWREIRSWPGAPGFSSHAFSKDEHWCLISTSHPNTPATSSLLDLTTGRQMRLDLDWYVDTSFSPDGKLFAGSSWGGHAELWETATQRPIGLFRGFLGGAWSVAFSPDGKRLATGSNGQEAIKLWDVESQRELLALPGQGSMFNSSAFSTDGNILGSKNFRGLLHIWRAPSWAEIEAAEKERK
jgi:serine/threonine protein kinase